MNQVKKTGPSLVGKPEFMSTETYALCILMVSSVFYSAMGAFIKLATSTGIPSSQLVLLRALFQGPLVLVAMMYFRDNNQSGTPLIFLPFGTPDVRNIVLVRGIVGGIGFMLYYYSTSALPLGDAVTILSLNPVFTVLAAAVFLGEAIRPIDIGAALGCVIGCVLIANPSFLFGEPFDESKHSTSGYIAALLGACCGATVFILIRRAGKGGVHTLQLLLSWVTFGTLFSLVVGVGLPAIFGIGNHFIWPPSLLSWVYILGNAAFGSMGHLLLNYAARHAPAGLSAIVRSSGILWSYCLEIVVFHQVPERLTGIGVLLIVTSLAMIALEKHQDSIRKKNKLAAAEVGGGEEEPLKPRSTPQESNNITAIGYGAADMKQPK